MIDSIIAALSGLSPAWAVFIISILPIAELRVAIPLGIALGMPPLEAFGLAILGNALPILPLLLVFPRFFEWLYRFEALKPFLDRLIRRTRHKGDGVNKRGALGLFLFVGIPVPGTGVWTGCFVAYLLGMRIRHAFISILLGMLLAGTVMTLSSLGVISIFKYLNGAEYILLAVLVVALIYYFCRRKK